jgi:hypothetical protein
MPSLDALKSTLEMMSECRSAYLFTSCGGQTPA